MRPLIAASAILMVVLGACGAQTEEAPAEPQVRPAKLLEIAASENVRVRTFPAIVEASSSVTLTFQVGGLIEDVAVNDGDEVEAGDVIARLDQRDFRNNLATAQAQYDSAQSDFARAARLLEQDAIARSVYEQRLAQRDVARASLDSAQKALDDTLLRSPFDGVVAEVFAVDFQNIGAQQPVATLQTSGDAEAVVQVPATLVANSGRIEPIETVLILDAAPNRRLPATLYAAATQADTQTQTFEARFAFSPPADLRVLPGMTGQIEARLILASEDGATDRVTVPLSAVIYRGAETFVWLVDPDTMTVSPRTVELEQGIGETLRVIAGLEPGDVIVGAGAAFLHEGMQVRRYEP